VQIKGQHAIHTTAARIIPAIEVKPDDWAAIVWMCQNQLGRRNLSDAQKTYLIGKEQEAMKHTEKFHGNQYTGQSILESTKSTGRTAQKIADANKIGYGTVIRAEHFAKGLDAAEAVSPGIKDVVLGTFICIRP
jgi:hypothetical protein